MHLHILGICGTFMGSLAILAKQQGFKVTGSDANVYPPMSTQLEEQGIELISGFDPAQLDPAPDLVVIGNAMSRGNPCVEYVLNKGLPYTSGPEWLSRYVLQDKWVLAVAGTHGKTSTSSLLAWILEYAGMSPGFLIGGVPKNFGVSARIGETPFFVVEADEYDTAFFDKRSKFVHYRPRTAILNNLEFDHADIFPDLAAIQRQFHHLVRTIPSEGLVITPASDNNVEAVINQGCWTPTVSFGSDQGAWQASLIAADGSEFDVVVEGQLAARVTWSQQGQHSVMNALAAMAAARHVGVSVEHAAAALTAFEGVKRRMDLIGEVNTIAIYDDFAHHPTAIETTLQGLRAKHPDASVLALIEPRSNTMRMGVHQSALSACTAAADQVFWYQPSGLDWNLDSVCEHSAAPSRIFSSVDDVIHAAVEFAQPGTQIVVMSNGGFEGIHGRLLSAVRERFDVSK